MSVTALAGAGAVVAALLAVVVVLAVALRRLQRSSDARSAAAARDPSARAEPAVDGLREELRLAQAEGRRERLLGELAGSLDLDEVLDRVLRAARILADADAALAVVPDTTSAPPTAALGLSSEEAAAASAALPPAPGEAGPIELGAGFAGLAGRPGEGPIQSGLSVPLRCEERQLGALAVFTRSPSRRFDERTLHELAELARRAGAAIDNARRFRELRTLADLDALTGLHNRRFFHATLEREVARARRYDRRLALVVFDVDDFKAVNDRIGHLAGDTVLAELAVRVRSVVRSADVACRIGGDEFAVIVPEADILDAQQLSRRLQEAVSSTPIARAGRLEISAGLTEVRAGDDAASFFERADEALYGAKARGKGRVVAVGGPA